jgi:hypothetical protein
MVNGNFYIILEFETISRHQETVLAPSMDSLYISLQFVIHTTSVSPFDQDVLHRTTQFPEMVSHVDGFGLSRPIPLASVRQSPVPIH